MLPLTMTPIISAIMKIKRHYIYCLNIYVAPISNIDHNNGKKALIISIIILILQFIVCIMIVSISTIVILHSNKCICLHFAFDNIFAITITIQNHNFRDKHSSPFSLQNYFTIIVHCFLRNSFVVLPYRSCCSQNSSINELLLTKEFWFNKNE